MSPMDGFRFSLHILSSILTKYKNIHFLCE
jgi:hypothetical protein